MRAIARVALAAICVAACTSGVATDPATGGGNTTHRPRASVLSVTPTSIAGTVGQTTALTASVLDQDGHPITGQTVTWSSSTPQTASVSDAGTVTLLAVGSAQISASAASLTTAVPVTVTAAPPPPVAAISVSPTSVSLNPGGVAPLTAVPTDATGHVVTGATITWTSSNTSAATVSTSGVVKAVAVGAAVITASAQGTSATASVTVVAPSPASVASVAVSPSPASVHIGRTVQLTATLKDSTGTVLGGRTVTWVSSNQATATVSSTGVVAGVAQGTATITATSGGVSGTSMVTVTPVPVASVVVTPGAAGLTPGQTLQLTATARDSGGITIPGGTTTWTSSNTGVATVSSSGLVMSIAAGSATITAAIGGKSGTSAITVSPAPVASVTVAPTSVSIVAGQTSQLTATAKDSGGTALTGRSTTWSSSATSVATVSSTGLVAAVAAGSATITVTIGGKSATASITATPRPVATVTVTPATASLVAGSTVQLTATDKDAVGQVITGQPVTWTSSNTAFATVSSSGLVTAVASGGATITATSAGKQGTATITVSPKNTASECAAPQAGWIWCDDFDTDRTSQYFEYNSAGGNFVRASGVGLGGSTGMRTHYVAGTNPDFGFLHLAIGKTPSSYFKSVDAGTANYRELYWRVYVFYPSTWVGGGAVKMSRAVSVVKSDWSEAAFAQVWSGTTGSSVNYLYNDPASGTDAAGNIVTSGYNDFAHMRWLGGSGSSAPIFDAAHVGSWYCIEAHAKLNDPGASNGVQQLYINGTLSAQTTGMNWVGNYTDYGFNVVMLENYWNNGAQATEDRYFDNFVVSTRPIGCAPTP